MFNRRILAVGAASAALAASGVLGTAVSASAAAMPGPAGPVTTVPNQPASGQPSAGQQPTEGQQPTGTSPQPEKPGEPGSAIAKPSQSLVQAVMGVLSGGSPQPGQMQPMQAPAQP